MKQQAEETGAQRSQPWSADDFSDHLKLAVQPTKVIPAGLTFDPGRRLVTYDCVTATSTWSTVDVGPVI
jgi:hypothetical protein